MPKFSLKVETKTFETKEIDLEFPIYFWYDGTWDSDMWSTYSRIVRVQKDMSTLTVSKHKSFVQKNAEYEISENRIYDFSTFSHHFSSKPEYGYTNDSSDFDEILSEIREMVG